MLTQADERGQINLYAQVCPGCTGTGAHWQGCPNEGMTCTPWSKLQLTWGGWYPSDQQQGTPYKCPCCDGWGKRQEVRSADTEAYREVACPSCGGTGVVWR